MLGVFAESLAHARVQVVLEDVADVIGCLVDEPGVEGCNLFVAVLVQNRLGGCTTAHGPSKFED